LVGGGRRRGGVESVEGGWDANRFLEPGKTVHRRVPNELRGLDESHRSTGEVGRAVLLADHASSVNDLLLVVLVLHLVVLVSVSVEESLLILRELLHDRGLTSLSFQLPRSAGGCCRRRFGGRSLLRSVDSGEVEDDRVEAPNGSLLDVLEELLLLELLE